MLVFLEHPAEFTPAILVPVSGIVCPRSLCFWTFRAGFFRVFFLSSFLSAVSGIVSFFLAVEAFYFAEVLLVVFASFIAFVISTSLFS